VGLASDPDPPVSAACTTGFTDVYNLDKCFAQTFAETGFELQSYLCLLGSWDYRCKPPHWAK
jgi:hypothetical protein